MRTTRDDRRVLLALSGGVDSAVAALLLKERGFSVLGAFIRMWSGDDGARGECGWKAERRDAYAVAARLGIPAVTFDFTGAYRREVLEEFYAAYGRGETPNPDVACNSRVKFPLLLAEADRRGIGWIATGHYARVERHGAVARLLAARDAGKDQTYFLAGLGQRELRRTLFPIGDFRKTEVRERARAAGLPVWGKRSTRGICFVGKVDLPAFLRQRIPDAPGPVIAGDGTVLGRHAGMHAFTIGQRHGLGIGGGRPLYVSAKDPGNRAVVVTADEEDILAGAAMVREMHWIAESPAAGETLSVRCRYRAPQVGATIARDAVVFAAPQRAVTPGQHLVFSRGEECLGTAVVVEALKRAPGESCILYACDTTD